MYVQQVRNMLLHSLSPYFGFLHHAIFIPLFPFSEIHPGGKESKRKKKHSQIFELVLLCARAASAIGENLVSTSVCFPSLLLYTLLKDGRHDIVIPCIRAIPLRNQGHENKREREWKYQDFDLRFFLDIEGPPPEGYD